MTRYKMWTVIGKVVTGIGLLTGCGTVNTGAADTGTAQTTKSVNDRGANAESGSFPSQAVGRTTAHGNANASLLGAMSVMPKPRLWHRMSSSGDLAIQTLFGTVRLSTNGITNHDVAVSLTSSGQPITVYRFHHAGYKQVDGWQLQGRYLALRFRLPPSANPSTGDYGYEDVVVNLQSRKLVFKEPSTLQSTDYLSNPYFVQSAIRTRNEIPQSRVDVVRLLPLERMRFELPKNALGLGIVSNGKLYFEEMVGTARKVTFASLPAVGWRSLTDPDWRPMHLSSTR